MSWVTANTTIGTITWTTAETATVLKRCAPALGMWKYQFIEISRGKFEPQALKKNQTSISQEIEEKILSMCANGMTTDDIAVHIQDIFPAIQSDSNSNVHCFLHDLPFTTSEPQK